MTGQGRGRQNMVWSHFGDEYGFLLKSWGAVVSIITTKSSKKRTDGELLPHWRQQHVYDGFSFLASIARRKATEFRGPRTTKP